MSVDSLINGCRFHRICGQCSTQRPATKGGSPLEPSRRAREPGDVKAARGCTGGADEASKGAEGWVGEV